MSTAKRVALRAMTWSTTAQPASRRRGPPPTATSGTGHRAGSV
eukprot:gene22037-32852_t